MHTSQILQSGDFQYWRRERDALVQVDFNTCFPDYRCTDRLGVVSPHLEDGALHTRYALLAATTTFYDDLRARGGEFFDYPHHFAFFDVTAEGIAIHGGRQLLDQTTFGAWSSLDVWPESQWIQASSSVEGMLQHVFAWQINCLFWPESFMPALSAEPLPPYVQPLLAARLKTVYYYDATHPDVEIHVNDNVEDLMRERCLSRLPEGVREAALSASVAAAASESPFPYVERYRRVPVDAFLADMAPCFQNAA
ncbi:hypothetical protein [Candidatus Entotheonella palauensis]|uniref:Uncharacterized protein n=1 Tax=Candidatus Entotheonella gemina TaxID=1429439 RepID=W4M0K6_9BACT|nr:hypothetical protein [Candidatus Entotheonella palauensis]ETX03678.1 MAG: hypothetical protein ETSY2_32820 [Candidatus Entotheonella gemina]